MSTAHDRSQVGLPASKPFVSAPTSAREDEMASWRKREAEAQKVVDDHNSNPESVGIMSHGWAWKGYGMVVDIPVNPLAVFPTSVEILATEQKIEPAANK